MEDMSVKDKDWLWHLRFGNYNLKSLKFFSFQYMVHGLPRIEVKNDLCEARVL